MTLSQDAFTRADANDLGGNYDLLSGLNPRIVSNRVLPSTSTTGGEESHVLYATLCGSADMYAQVDAKWVSDYGNLTLIARGTDIDNHYLCFINQQDRRAEVVCWKAGGYRQLRTGTNDELTWSVGTTVTFRLEVTGTGATVTIVLKANGVTVFTLYDSDTDRLTTGQRGGFGFAYVPNDSAFEVDNYEQDQIGGGTDYTESKAGTITPVGAITTNKTTGSTGGTDSITKTIIVTEGEVEVGIWEAEDAALTTTYPTDPYAMRATNENAGYLGTGYVGVWGLTGEYITFTLPGMTAGDYTLHYRYQQCANDTPPTRTVWVNGTQIATPSFPRTGQDWTVGTWVEVTLDVDVTLINGSNTIQFRYAGSAGGFVDLDRIRLSEINPDPPPTPDPPPPVVDDPGAGDATAGISVAAKALLEQVGLAGRVESVRFDLTDRDGNIIGVVHPRIGVTIANSVDGLLKRSAQGFVLPPDEVDDVDISNDRVVPKWVLDGVTDVFPLGVFMWASASRQPWSYGTWMPGALLDQGLILGQGMDRHVSLAAGDSIEAAIVDVCGRAGFSNIIIESTNALVAAPVAWAPGATYGSALSALAAQGGYFDWYFDNYGKLTFRKAVDPNNAVPLTRYEYGGRIIDGTIQVDDDALSAPNRYVVVDTASAGAAIVGVYNLPDDDPNSAKRRGRVIPKFINAPGIGSVAAAEEHARSAAQQDPSAYQTVKFQSLPDPRHDTFDVVGYEGDNYLELGWRLTCAPGGPHEHIIKRVFPAAVTA